jgi:NhaP-type Na+/H+ or K+/H+ antiporter
VALQHLCFFRLAFLPCLAEAGVVGAVSHWLLGLPWLWSLMLGCVLAAVSPAVVVPCLLSLQDRGFGVKKVSAFAPSSY